MIEILMLMMISPDSYRRGAQRLVSFSFCLNCGGQSHSHGPRLRHHHSGEIVLSFYNSYRIVVVVPRQVLVDPVSRFVVAFYRAISVIVAVDFSVTLGAIDDTMGFYRCFSSD
jgi:hypothetical protein